MSVLTPMRPESAAPQLDWRGWSGNSDSTAELLRYCSGNRYDKPLPHNICSSVEASPVLPGSCSLQPRTSTAQLSASPPSPAPLRKVASCTVKKRVQFADEVGQQLARVRVLSYDSAEPREESAAWSLEFWRQLALSTRAACGGGRLRCCFAQPVCNYPVLCASVQANAISLSSLRFCGSAAHGCVAVKNLAFSKRVFARVSFDAWRSFRDIDAAYTSSDGDIDVFSFNFACPSDQQQDISFCLCFRCDAGEFWDNNDGSNYTISVQPQHVAAISLCDLPPAATA